MVVKTLLFVIISLHLYIKPNIMQNKQTAEILTRSGLFYNRLIHKIKTLFTSNKNAPVILCRKDNDREIYKFDSLYKASKEM